MGRHSKNHRQFVSYLQAAVTSLCLVSGLLFSYFCYKFPLTQIVTGEERSPDARGGKGGGGERMRRMSNDEGRVEKRTEKELKGTSK